MGRTVADVALLTSVISGRHPIDHDSWGPTGELIPLEGGAEGLRIGVSLRLGDFPVAPEIIQNTRTIADALRRRRGDRRDGAAVDDSADTRDDLRPLRPHPGPAVARETAGYEAESAAYMRQFLIDTAAAAQRYSLVDSLAMDARIRGDLATAMTGLDALLCPTSAVTSLRADGEYLDGIDVPGGHLQHYWECHLTTPFNVANHCPVVALPSGLSGEGVPTSVQVAGHPRDEAMTYRVARAVESVNGFRLSGSPGAMTSLRRDQISGDHDRPRWASTPGERTTTLRHSAICAGDADRTG